MDYPFNIESNEGGASITIDNKILYYTKCIRNEKGYNNCDIYYVFNHNGRWSEVHPFSDKISNLILGNHNLQFLQMEKPSFLLVIEVGVMEKLILYEINLVDGKWTTPKNLGSNINSNEHEKSPYLHTDGKTLFFASTNFPNLGGFDIFYSKKDSLEIGRNL